MLAAFQFSFSGLSLTGAVCLHVNCLVVTILSLLVSDTKGRGHLEEKKSVKIHTLA